MSSLQSCKRDRNEIAHLQHTSSWSSDAAKPLLTRLLAFGAAPKCHKSPQRAPLRCVGTLQPLHLADQATPMEHLMGLDCTPLCHEIALKSFR